MARTRFCLWNMVRPDKGVLHFLLLTALSMHMAPAIAHSPMLSLRKSAGLVASKSGVLSGALVPAAAAGSSVALRTVTLGPLVLAEAKQSLQRHRISQSCKGIGASSSSIRNRQCAAVPSFSQRESRRMATEAKAGAGEGAPTTVAAVNVDAATADAVDATSALEDNPLLADSAFPLFDKVEPKHVVPGIRKIIEETDAALSQLEQEVQPSWPGLVEPLERLGDRLTTAWGVVNHLKRVKDSPELRAAVEEVQPQVVTLTLRMGQSKPLFDAFSEIQSGPLWATLNDAQRRIVEAELDSARMSGVALEGEEKTRFNEIKQELATLSTKFMENALDANKRFSKLVTDPEDVAGLPPSALLLASQAAIAKGHDGSTPETGPWLLTLDLPCYMPVMKFCRKRAIREELYRAYISRAAADDIDNLPLIDRILSLRKEKAKLLGFENHAELAMVTRMATLETAEKLLEDLRAASWDASVREYEELKAHAREQGAAEADDIRQWDATFWSERLREAKFELEEESLRPYFSFPSVIDGLFSLATFLFDVKIEPANGLAPVWHPDVQFFRVTDLNNVPIAYFYLDPYTRPAEKSAGAWMDSVVGRSRLLAPAGESSRLPVAHMVCNQTPPLGDKPSLMTFREVETLFHEFGHALQHMLTRQEEGLVAGIRNVEWDAVELPSQFMENWCYHKPSLMAIAKHYETGEALPEDLFQKILAARTFHSATMMMRQLYFACLDLDLHARYDPTGSDTVLEVQRRVAEKTLVLQPLPEDRFLCSFGHIFAGGYAAGYYSYKWAEVLSADAFAAFEDVGLENEEAVKEMGRRFRETVLALGGGKAAKNVFLEFRGREPSTEPLLRHSGLLPVAKA